MAVKQLPKISDLPEPPDRLVGDQERFDVLTFNSLKAQKKMVNEDLNKTLIPALNQFAVDVNASVDAAALSERNAHDSEEVAKRKAGEASGSAGAAKVSEDNAKVSETNALASKNAAALSAESAESDRIAAEAARDEAQDLANVGYASESRAGLAKVDGKTTRADAGGAITVKDVAIEGDLGDLASARGQIGDAKEMPNLDFNTLTTPGNYRITGNPTNGPSLPLNISGASIGSLIVAGTLGQNGRIFQIMISGSTVTWRTVQNSTGTTWSAWQQLLSGNKVGDGIRVTNGIISVPEMQGATVSTAGTSGLVPPAAAGQHESFLTGGGEYKPALTKISDSVSLEDSKTAASAKAVKTAYDRGTAGVTAANGKLSLSGGVMSGRIGGLRGNYNADASSRYVTGALEIRENGGVGNAQSDIAYAPTIGFHWANRVAGLLALRSDGIFSFMKQNGTRAVVDCDVPYATAANKLRREGGVDTSWYWSGQGGQPGWLWGGNDGTNMYVYNPANFSVNYANSAYISTAVSGVWFGRNNQTVPSGGTWRVITSINGKVDFMTVAGGTSIPHDWWYAVRVA
ncbi:hypothetical protein [Bilophila wadsworthia]|uniref:hypothetical protein n=1 Tax=Bilophila wadsworthia TaxID=35833 RepID=UPI00206D0005|nr:MAG TPA: L SHAPED TAIL FIBER PROTEIN [Caudoviricetes sp.]